MREGKSREGKVYSTVCPEWDKRRVWSGRLPLCEVKGRPGTWVHRWGESQDAHSRRGWRTHDEFDHLGRIDPRRRTHINRLEVRSIEGPQASICTGVSSPSLPHNTTYGFVRNGRTDTRHPHPISVVEVTDPRRTSFSLDTGDQLKSDFVPTRRPSTETRNGPRPHILLESLGSVA